MKLTHPQARLQFEAALDTAHFYGQTPKFDPVLSEHLAGCPICQAYTEQSSSIDAHLTRHLPQTWPVPSIPSQKINQAIHTVHNRMNRKHPLKLHNFWDGMRHAWLWGIGLAGVALLVGIR